jgi:cytochrome P450
VLTTFRSLALLASHPQQASAARKEIDARSGPEMDQMPYLRATVLESLRLWPTSPLILRETTHATSWRNGVMRPNTGLVIFTPFFHRNAGRTTESHAAPLEEFHTAHRRRAFTRHIESFQA